jgi:hypothetical protein
MAPLYYNKALLIINWQSLLYGRQAFPAKGFMTDNNPYLDRLDIICIFLYIRTEINAAQAIF